MCLSPIFILFIPPLHVVKDTVSQFTCFTGIRTGDPAFESNQCQINIAGGGRGDGVHKEMRCHIQVIFVFFQTQAGWQLVIPVARIYERCFSCALISQTITAEWDRANPRRGHEPCLHAKQCTDMHASKQASKRAHTQNRHSHIQLCVEGTLL